MTDVRTEQIEVWRAAAPGWDRQRALVWEATHVLSERMIELIAPEQGERIVEIAAGPGDTGFLAAGLVGPTGSLVSTDAAPEMVDTARRRAEELGLANVEFAVGDAAELSFESETFDAAICRFGVMLVPDSARAVAEVARVVRPGGRAVYAVWAEPGRNPWMTAPGRAAQELGIMGPPEPDAPGPFRLAAPGALRALAERAGLEGLTEEEVEITWHARSLEEWWASTLDLSRTLAMLVERISAEELEAIRQTAQELLAGYVRAGGSVHVPGVARVLLGQR